MKWFKHDTDAFTSEGVSALIESEGFAGYGRWMRLLEIVAFKMDETNRCHVEYPIKKWCSLLGVKQKKLISFLEVTENKLKTKVTVNENKIRIEIPNLLNKRDNYTRHLQVSSNQLESIEGEVEVDRDKKEGRGKATPTEEHKPQNPAPLKILHSIKGWPVDLRKDDELVASIMEDYKFTETGVVRVARELKDHYAEGVTKKDRPRSKLRTFARKRREWDEGKESLDGADQLSQAKAELRHHSVHPGMYELPSGRTQLECLQPQMGAEDYEKLKQWCDERWPPQ